MNTQDQGLEQHNDTASTTSFSVLITLLALTLKTMTTNVHFITLRSGEAIVISIFTESGTARAKSLNITRFETEIFGIS